MSCEGTFDALWQKPLAYALTPPRERGPTTLCLHARAKSVLTFPRSL
jgi:hypothetical protein